jgi:hypothetical protein
MGRSRWRARCGAFLECEQATVHGSRAMKRVSASGLPERRISSTLARRTSVTGNVARTPCRALMDRTCTTL